MDYEMTSILEIIAEMNSFSKTDDDLSALIDQFDDGELDEEDLSMVSAANSLLPFPDFLKKEAQRLSQNGKADGSHKP